MKPIAIEREFDFSAQDFQFLAALAYTQTGIVLKPQKTDMLYGRVARRLRALGLRDIASYRALLESEHGQSEMGNLINAITTNLTSFFREAHHFEHLARQVIIPFAAQKKSSRLRIWSAGCSAGAEPYSIAMMLAENLSESLRRDALVLATDIDTNMLATASEGVYEDSWIQKIPAPLRAKYALPQRDQPDHFRMHEHLRKLIRFKPLNLLEHWPMQGLFDAIFCRNVVIYFDKDTQRHLFDRMAERLKPGGFLYLGHSETMHALCNRFALVGTTTYRRMA